MNELPIGQMPAEEFEALMEDFISRRSDEDDRLPGDVFFELLEQSEKARLQLAAQETRKPFRSHPSQPGGATLRP